MNDTRNLIVDKLVKSFDDELIARNVEKCIYNYTIDYSKSNNIDRSWDNFMFKHVYVIKSIQLCDMIERDEHLKPFIIDNDLSTQIAYFHFGSLNKDYIKTTDENNETEDTSDDDEEGMFKCKKCQSAKTTYYSIQTRSADEPMTNFITCGNCGNRWKN